MFVFCKKCGLILNKNDTTPLCDACDTHMEAVPAEYLSASGKMFASRELRKKFEAIIAEGDDFDVDMHNQRDSVIEAKNNARKAEIEGKVSEYNQSRAKFTCPLCHSEKLSKISNVGKVVKVGVFGILGAGDIGKKYKCEACGYKF